MASFNHHLKVATDAAESIPDALGSLQDAISCLPKGAERKRAVKAVRLLRDRINTLQGRSLVILNHCKRRGNGFCQPSAQ